MGLDKVLLEEYKGTILGIPPVLVAVELLSSVVFVEEVVMAKHDHYHTN